MDSGKSSVKVLKLLADTADMTIPQLAKELRLSTMAVEKQIAKLQQDNQLKRIGSERGGHWQVN
jgi:ATP-dependent DNA helicase RecG